MIIALMIFNSLLFFPAMLAQLIVGLILLSFGGVFNIHTLRKHGIFLALAVDQNLNVIWLGHPDETISSRLGRAVTRNPRWFVKYMLHPFVDGMFALWGDHDHAINAIEQRFIDKEELVYWHKDRIV